jgi:phospholipid/cholesterol/gamma-HCH transport system substrate-binding protein
MSTRNVRIALSAALAVLLVAGAVVVVRSVSHHARQQIVAYFDNSNGIFVGDEIRILGVPVGEIERIEPQPDNAKITFWVDKQYKVPAEVKAVIISPQLVTARAIQLIPAYSGGPVLGPDAVIPESRTAVPVEWDDFREQLQTLTDTLQPTEPGGVSPLGSLINTAADNLRGEGGNIRETLIELSQAFSALGDHSGDLFTTIKNLSILVSALRSSTNLMSDLNRNLAGVTAAVANGPDEVGRAVEDINTAAGDVQSFVADNKEALGTTSDKLASITTAIYESIDDVKQTLHLAPNAFQNFMNIFEPGGGSGTGVLAATNFQNPISFLCGGLQAASRMNAEQSAKLCVQYLAPIMKNRQFNFPPIGVNPIVGAMARPNEITYSEDWMRPDYRASAPGPTVPEAPLAAEQGLPASEVGAPAPTNPDPAAGLPGMMLPAGAGS